MDGSAARAYGVYQEGRHVAVRGLFIIDPEGLVQYQVVHSLSVGRRSQEVLRVLAALAVGRAYAARIGWPMARRSTRFRRSGRGAIFPII